MPELTSKQLEVVLLRADGISNKEIAARLGVSYETVKRRLMAACRRFGAVDNANLMLLAGRAGLLGEVSGE